MSDKMTRLDKIAAMLANSLVENEMATVDDVALFDANIAARDLLAVVREVAGLHQPLPNSANAMHPAPLCACDHECPCPTARALQALTETHEEN